MPRAPRTASRASRTARPPRASDPKVAQSDADPALVSAGWQRVRLALRDHGMLLQSDPTLPNVAALVAGETVRGSWWGHAANHSIFHVTTRLARHPDALATKLIDGKTTWVHRRLWPALLAAATAGEPWQARGLSPGARALHARLRREGGVSASGPVARELQARLLAIGEEVHTDAGHHATRLLTWERWAARDMAAGPSPGPPHAERLLDEAARLLGGEAVVERLPWHAVQSAGRRTQQASPTARGGKPRTAPGA